MGLRDEVTYEAEVVFFVPPNVAGQQPPGDQDAAVKLAKTYAAAIPLNQELMTASAEKSRESMDYVGSHLEVTNDTGTSILRVKYAGSSAEATAALLTYLSGRLIAYSPPKPVSAGSLKIVNLPDTAVAKGGDIAGRFPLGLSLGVVAALALAFVLETVRPRIDTVREGREALGVPVIWWDAEAAKKIQSLLQRSRATASRPSVELVPADQKTLSAALVIEAQLAEALELDKSAEWPILPNGHSDIHPRQQPSVITRPIDTDRELDHRQSICEVIVLRCGALRSSANGAAEALATQSHPPAGAIMTASHDPRRSHRGRR
jgi:capsular polysaccharide biosynthesis protein